MSRKRPAPREIQRIRQQLNDPVSPEDLPFDIRWARRILAQEQPDPPEVLRPEVSQALCDELVQRQASESLSFLASKGSKELAKAARRGIHRLRSSAKMEVAVPLSSGKKDAPVSLSNREAQIPPGLVTMYDHRMQRAVWLPQEGAQGLVLYQARISAVWGLVDFEIWSSSRKKYREIVKQIKEQMAAADVAQSTAHWYIRQAAQRCQAAQRAVPSMFSRAKQSLGPPPDAPHPAMEIPPAQATDEDLVTALDVPELTLWLPDQDLMQELSLKLDEIATSPLVLDATQQHQRRETVLQAFLEREFAPQRCQAHRQVLLDTAQLLWAAQKKEAAQLVRAAADVFDLTPERLRVHPLPRRFLRRFVQETLDTDEEAPETSEPASTGSIILP